MGKKLLDGKALSEKGKLKLALIDTFTSFYELSLGENKGDCEKNIKSNPRYRGSLLGKC